jgi:hypothetical protein
MIDDLKMFIEYVPYIKRISYEDENRTPNKFLPVMAREFGVELFESAASNIAKSKLYNYHWRYNQQRNHLQVME